MILEDKTITLDLLRTSKVTKASHTDLYTEQDGS